MKVYLLWDEADYYGPDPGSYDYNTLKGEHPWVFAAREDAVAAAIERSDARRPPLMDVPWPFTIEEIEVHERT